MIRRARASLLKHGYETEGKIMMTTSQKSRKRQKRATKMALCDVFAVSWIFLVHHKREWS
jgi:hypothetical protein